MAEKQFGSLRWEMKDGKGDQTDCSAGKELAAHENHSSDPQNPGRRARISNLMAFLATKRARGPKIK
jgi:hypothetical protein